MLSAGQKFAFSFGHVINDLTASMWFSYLLVFFIHVLSFPNDYAGRLLLIGQIADALSTVFVGIESDRMQRCVCSYSRRKSWHLLGVLCTVLAFPFIFLPCIHCSDSALWAQMIYFSPFVIIFQFGWACVQISHLSMINELCHSEQERVTLTSYRNAFSIFSNVLVYFAATLLLHSSRHRDASVLTPSDSAVFLKLVAIVIIIGTSSSAVFHLCTHEKSRRSEEERTNAMQTFSFSGLFGLFQNRRFYFTAALYMCSRLISNVTQAYLPLFATEYIGIFGKNTLGTAPLICYLSGIITSFVIRYVTKTIGKMPTLLIAVLLTFSYSTVFFFVFDFGLLGISPKSSFLIASSFLGIGSAGLVVISLSIISDIISEDTRYNAFVYGTMSFLDKVSCGLAIALLQNLAPSVGTVKLKSYVHMVIVFFPSSVAFLELILLLPKLLFHTSPPPDLTSERRQMAVFEYVNWPT